MNGSIREVSSVNGEPHVKYPEMQVEFNLPCLVIRIITFPLHLTRVHLEMFDAVLVSWKFKGGQKDY